MRERVQEPNGHAAGSGEKGRYRRRLPSQRRTSAGCSAGHRDADEVWPTLRVLGTTRTRKRGSEENAFKEQGPLRDERLPPSRSQASVMVPRKLRDRHYSLLSLILHLLTLVMMMDSVHVM